ncbi:MAG: MlaE family lipid ABC transporter permease subunit [Pseudomonadota bacterium]
MRQAEALEIGVGAGASDITLQGAASLTDAARLSQHFDALPDGAATGVDLSRLTRLDTAAAYALVQAEARVNGRGGQLRFHGASPEAESLLRRIRDAVPEPDAPEPERRGLAAWLEACGRGVASGVASFAETLGFFGLFLSRLFRAVVRPKEFRLTALVHHIEAVGLQAVPIVALMSFLIGVVLAFQGSTQLRQFGAEVFVVDLIAISILRELGVLLTAIIVAGRTASAFTAAIGSMKMREEIDAMQTLAIDPAQALFVPRILALVITLPILALIANVAGLVGGAIMSWIELGISPSMFQTRLFDGTDLRHVWVGLVKAPVFALIIGVIGCRSGMLVERDAESLGRMTSRAVVAAIFAVIVADAAFSIFFAQIGI